MRVHQAQNLRTRFVRTFLAAWPEDGVPGSAIEGELQFQLTVDRDGDLTLSVGLLSQQDVSSFDPDDDELDLGAEVEAVATKMSHELANLAGEPARWSDLVCRRHAFLHRHGA